MNTQSIKKFINEDLWSMATTDLPYWKRIGLKLLKVMILATREFGTDKCQMHASALTFYTLLSIVPVFALLFGVAKGFGFQQRLEEQLLEQGAEQEALMRQIVQFAQNFLENSQGGVIAGVGIVVLFWIVIKLIGNIEASFNEIWKVEQGRPLARKFSDYLSIMLLSPILLILSSSITVYITATLNKLAETVALNEYGSTLLLTSLKIIPYLIIWVLFSFVYVFIPNTSVKIKSGILAGIIAGTIYQIVQVFYFGVQVNVSSYSAIYGSFAALPLFLVWLQLSWLILLFGAEIAYVYQNFGKLASNIDEYNLSGVTKKTVALQIAHYVVQKYANAESPVTPPIIAEGLGLPLSLTASLSEKLIDADVLVEATPSNSENKTIIPACDPERITIAYVITALDGIGDQHPSLSQTGLYRKFAVTLNSFAATIRKSNDNRRLRDIN